MKRLFIIFIGLFLNVNSVFAEPDVAKSADSVGATTEQSVSEKNKKSVKKSEKAVLNKKIKKNKDGTTEITMTGLEAVQLAGRLVEAGDYPHAMQILTKMPQTGSLPVEIERWYLIAQVEQRTGNIDGAIKIYRKILDDQPDLSKIRYELALCYMAKERWYRADYHLRLAMAGKDIPEPIKQRMMYYRYIARKNKNWNVWFNFGAAPDNNVNQATGGKECILWHGMFYGCSQNPEPEKALGYNLLLGGNYEFKLSDEHWRWKNDANIYTNLYNKPKYDDLYLSSSSGPRYVWENGDVWLAGVISRRWYGSQDHWNDWGEYNWAYGVKLDTNYDWTRKLSSGLMLRFMDNKYDDYGDFLNGQSYTVSQRFSYSFDSTKYIVLRGGVNRDTAKMDAYANWRYDTGVGFGAALPWGFHTYLEPSFSWIRYDGERLAVKDESLKFLRAKDFVQRYALSISNNNFEIWGFVPTVTISYTDKDSNIHNRTYKKTTVEFTFQQRF